MSEIKFKSYSGEEPQIDDRSIRAIIGRVDVVDNENELIVGDTFKIDKIKASNWMHNSMVVAKLAGMVDEVRPPVGYGKGWVDGDKIIGEVKVMNTPDGNDFLEHVKSAGDQLGYSHGFKISRTSQRDDGVTLLHGVQTYEMSPVPDPASPGTRTLVPNGMKLLYDEGTKLARVVRDEPEETKAIDELVKMFKQFIEMQGAKETFSFEQFMSALKDSEAAIKTEDIEVTNEAAAEDSMKEMTEDKEKKEKKEDDEDEDEEKEDKKKNPYSGSKIYLQSLAGRF